MLKTNYVIAKNITFNKKDWEKMNIFLFSSRLSTVYDNIISMLMEKENKNDYIGLIKILTLE